MEPPVHPDWSGLPGDLIETVLNALNIPDLFSAGAVCTSWHAAFSAVRRVRVPIKDASPCLLYSCAADDADTATIYSPSAGAVFKVRQPAPAFRNRYVIGSDHGWIVAADEESNLQALNPLTGAQVDLPPVTGLYNVENYSDDQGRPVYHFLSRQVYGDPELDDIPELYILRDMRLYLYERVYLSCSPSAGGECIVLLVHREFGDMSFARVGDSRWTRINRDETVPYDCRAAAYSKKDGLFYVLYHDCSIYTLDLNGSSPVVRKISESAAEWIDPLNYVVFAPWGDILQVWRYTGIPDTPVQVPAEYANEDIDPSYECRTDEIRLYKVDTHSGKLVQISSADLQGHALFLGFNSSMMLSIKDFPKFKPNCAYITEDNWEYIRAVNKFGCREVGIWDFETQALGSLGDDVHSTHPWLSWPPPIWFTPSLV